MDVEPSLLALQEKAGSRTGPRRSRSSAKKSERQRRPQGGTRARARGRADPRAAPWLSHLQHRPRCQERAAGALFVHELHCTLSRQSRSFCGSPLRLRSRPAGLGLPLEAVRGPRGWRGDEVPRPRAWVPLHAGTRHIQTQSVSALPLAQGAPEQQARQCAAQLPPLGATRPLAGSTAGRAFRLPALCAGRSLQRGVREAHLKPLPLRGVRDYL